MIHSKPWASRGTIWTHKKKAKFEIDQFFSLSTINLEIFGGTGFCGGQKVLVTQSMCVLT